MYMRHIAAEVDPNGMAGVSEGIPDITSVGWCGPPAACLCDSDVHEMGLKAGLAGTNNDNIRRRMQRINMWVILKEQEHDCARWHVPHGNRPV